MDSRTRALAALNHREPDHVPFDLGGTGLTTIHVSAYRDLRRYLGLPAAEPQVLYRAEQLASVAADVVEALQVDVLPAKPGAAAAHRIELVDEDGSESYVDEWGIRWRRPKGHGLYFDMVEHPLAAAETLAELEAHPFPDPLDPGRFAGLRAEAAAARAAGKLVALAGPCAGIVEVYSWMRGYEQFYVDLALNPTFVTAMLERMIDFKAAFWEEALQQVGDLVDVVVEADDLAAQHSLLMSPATYRTLIKPYHTRLFHFIKAQAPVKLFYHSCGAIRPLIPDLLEAGIDILNPVQISAASMDLQELKRDFGRDLVFWGGGVDTQQVLGSGTAVEIRDHVRRNVETLAPGGGFIFATVHDIQADVPPQNIMAMWEAWHDYGNYA